MKVKDPTIIYPAVFIIAAALVGTGMWAFASDTDGRIESSARQSYVFKTYLKDDAINIQSKDGVATLTGTVAEDSHKALAQETVANLPGYSNSATFATPGMAQQAAVWCQDLTLGSPYSSCLQSSATQGSSSATFLCIWQFACAKISD